MKQWRPYWLGLLVSTGLTPALWAQVPAASAVPGAAGAAAPAAAAPAAAPANIWSFLLPDQAKCAACKAKICASPLGQLLTNMIAPAAALSGGILNCCPPPNAPNAADLAQSSDTPAGAAAKIKADEAGAKKRREAVRYLGTVDCHYWPEAQKALINALRADRNECVRLEAAWVLGRGCCCTKHTIVALSITVAGSDRDGNPAENCERVKVAAAASLSHCLACLADPVPLTLEPPSTKKGSDTGPIEKLPPVPSPVSYYEQVDKLPLNDIVIVARRVLAKANAANKAAQTPDVAHSGAFNIIANAVAMNGTPSGKMGNVDTSVNPASPGTPASLGTIEVVTAEPTRGGVLSVLAHHLAPTSLNEGQTDYSSFKTPPFFLRKSPEEPVVILKSAEQGPSAQMGQPISGLATITAPVPMATTETLPAQAPLVITMPAFAPTAPKQTTPLTQTSYLATGPSPAPAGKAIVPPPVVTQAPVIKAVAPPPVIAQAPLPASDFPKYVRDLIVTVKTGKSCEEGLAAVFSLANSDWRTHPEVVLTLATAARQSPMLPVRITAIRCLVGIRANNSNVRTTLQALKSDADPTVRAEAEQALNSLVFYNPPGDSSVRR